MITINYLAVIVTGVVFMILGSIWYGPMFGNLWGRIIGMDMSAMTPEKKKEMQKKMWPLYALNFVLTLVTVYTLSYFIKSFPSMSGFTTAFWIWLGFVMPMAASGAMWSGKQKKMAWSMFWVTMGFQLVAFMLGAWILSMWK